MFGKVFASLWQGSMVGQRNAQHVFVYMIANADAEGFLDQTQEVIAALTGIPLDEVNKAIEMLSSPDPRSRSTDEEGRRIVPLDARGWGWQIVNYAKYRAMRDEEVRRGQNRERMRRVRAAANVCADVRPGVPPCAHAEGEGDGEGEVESKDASPERLNVRRVRGSLFPEGGTLANDQDGRSLSNGGVRASGGEIGAGRGAGGVLGPDSQWAAVEAIPLAAEGVEWLPTVAEFREMERLFPGVDVPAQFRRMRAWALANPKKRKTTRGVRAFVRTWLDGEQNRGGRGGGERGVAMGVGDRQKLKNADRYRQDNS